MSTTALNLIAIDPGTTHSATLEVFVPGIPKPAGSKRAFYIKKLGRAIITEDCKKSADWKGDVKNFAHVEMLGKQIIQAGPIALEIEFTMPRPKGHFGSGRNAAMIKPNAPHYHTIKPDATKLLRCVEDALTGTVYADDALIVDQRVTKRYGEKPGARITIRRME